MHRVQIILVLCGGTDVQNGLLGRMESILQLNLLE